MDRFCKFCLLGTGIALAFSFNAFAGNETVNKEAVVQFHAQVDSLGSMSKLDSKTSDKKVVQEYVDACKILRDNDSQCESTGTEPIIAVIEYSFMKHEVGIIPLGMEVKKMILLRLKYRQ